MKLSDEELDLFIAALDKACREAVDNPISKLPIKEVIKNLALDYKHPEAFLIASKLSYLLWMVNNR